MLENLFRPRLRSRKNTKVSGGFDTKFAPDRLFNLQAVATVIFCQLFHGFARFVAVGDDRCCNPRPGNHRASKADARVHYHDPRSFMFPQSSERKQPARQPFFIPLDSPQVHFQQFAHRQLAFARSIHQFSQFPHEQVAAVRLQLVFRQRMLRIKSPPQISNRTAHLHQRHAMLSPDRIQHVRLNHVHKRQLPRFLLRWQHNRRKEPFPRFHRVSSAHRPRPQRGHRQIQVMRPFCQRKRRQKPGVLTVEVVRSSRRHLSHRFLPNTTTKPFLCSLTIPYSLALIPCISPSHRPILHPQPPHPPELPLVIRHQRQPRRLGVRRNPQIVVPDQLPFALQLRPNRSISIRCGFRQSHHRKHPRQLPQKLQRRHPLRAFLRPVRQFPKRNHRERRLSRLQHAKPPQHLLRFFPSDVNTNVRVQQESRLHHNPLRFCGLSLFRPASVKSFGNAASKSNARAIVPARSRNTISSPRREISTSVLFTRNAFGSRTAWLFPDLNTFAVAIVFPPRNVYTYCLGTVYRAGWK